MDRLESVRLPAESWFQVWWLCVGVISGLVTLAAVLRGPRFAVGAAVGLSITLPAWVVWEVGGAPFHLKAAAAIAGLLAYILHPKSTYNLRFSAVDWAMAGLATVHLVSDTYHGGLQWGTLPRIYGEWFVPYVAGRVCVQEFPDAVRLLPVFALAAAVVASATIFEAFSLQNPYELVFGIPPAEHTPPNMIRWGLRRAHGSTYHPMYVGQLLLLLLPWSSTLIFRSIRVPGVLGGIASGLLTLVGIVCSTSRAAIVGVGLAWVAMLAAWPTRLQKWVFVMIALTIAGIAFSSDKVLGLLHEWSDERQYATRGAEAMTGTLSRINMFSVYSSALQQTGLIGFGTTATATFPPQVPMHAVDRNLKNSTRFVDNTYLLLTLRFGYLGGLLFVLALLSTVWTWHRLAAKATSVDALYCRAMLGALVGTMFGLTTVWMPHDYGFVLLWSMGISSGMWLGPGKVRRTTSTKPAEGESIISTTASGLTPEMIAGLRRRPGK